MATGSRTLGAVLTAIAVIVLIIGTIIAINTYSNRQKTVQSAPPPPPVPVVTEVPRAVPVGGVATGGGGTATDGGAGVPALAVAGAVAAMLVAGTALTLQRRAA